MTLPTLVRTWQTTRNNTVASQGAIGLTKIALLSALKRILLGESGVATLGLWTVVASSSAHVTNPGAVAAGTAGAGDNWGTGTLGPLSGDATPLTSSWGGARFPWIQLRQTGIATNFEVVISIPTQDDGQGQIWISTSAGFTGGTVGARPTATDEQNLNPALSISSGVDVQHQLHVWMSTDGKATRFFAWRGGTNLCTAFGFEVPTNAPAGWVNPSVSWGEGASAGIALSYSNLIGGTQAIARSPTPGAFAISFTCMSKGTAILPSLAGVGDVVNSFDGDWPLFGLGIMSIVTNAKGFHGALADLWWRPTAVNDADTFPNNASDRQFCAMGPLVLPWDPGGSTIPLLT